MKTQQSPKIQVGFPFMSMRKTMELLDCSKFYLYKLIKEKVIRPYYFQSDSHGKPQGKPYFNTDEIASVLTGFHENSLSDEIQ